MGKPSIDPVSGRYRNGQTGANPALTEQRVKPLPAEAPNHEVDSWPREFIRVRRHLCGRAVVGTTVCRHAERLSALTAAQRFVTPLDGGNNVRSAASCRTAFGQVLPYSLSVAGHRVSPEKVALSSAT